MTIAEFKNLLESSDVDSVGNLSKLIGQISKEDRAEAGKLYSAKAGTKVKAERILSHKQVKDFLPFFLPVVENHVGLAELADGFIVFLNNRNREGEKELDRVTRIKTIIENWIRAEPGFDEIDVSSRLGKEAVSVYQEII
mgnify:CR=1 FL=1